MKSQDKFSLALNAICLTLLFIFVSAGAKANFLFPLYLIVCGGPSIIAALIRHAKSQPATPKHQASTKAAPAAKKPASKPAISNKPAANDSQV